MPVSIRLQVEALTRMESELPAWLAQSADAIFSAISVTARLRPMSNTSSPASRLA